jgi:hypothetical protein
MQYARLAGLSTTLSARSPIPVFHPDDYTLATLKPTEDGYDLKQPVYADDEINDPTNRQVFGHMQGLIKRLDNAMIGLANSHPEFAATFADYRRQLGQDIAGTNIGGVWLAGAALAEFALALARGRLAGTMTEAVEPAVLADLLVRIAAGSGRTLARIGLLL